MNRLGGHLRTSKQRRNNSRWSRLLCGAKERSYADRKSRPVVEIPPLRPERKLSPKRKRPSVSWRRGSHGGDRKSPEGRTRCEPRTSSLIRGRRPCRRPPESRRRRRARSQPPRRNSHALKQRKLTSTNRFERTPRKWKSGPNRSRLGNG